MMNSGLGKDSIDWKNSVIEGMKYALTKIQHQDAVEIKLLDLNGHPCHSNNRVMFGIGLLSVFNNFGTELKTIDKEIIYDFIHRKNQEGIPVKSMDNDLNISIYSK